MTVWQQWWDIALYMGVWLAISVVFERLQRRSYLKRGKRDG